MSKHIINNTKKIHSTTKCSSRVIMFEQVIITTKLHGFVILNQFIRVQIYMIRTHKAQPYEELDWALVSNQFMDSYCSMQYRKLMNPCQQYNKKKYAVTLSLFLDSCQDFFLILYHRNHQCKILEMYIDFCGTLLLISICVLANLNRFVYEKTCIYNL